MAEDRFTCASCGRERANRFFYQSYSILNKHRKKMSVCIDCVVDLYDEIFKKYKDDKKSIYYTCRKLDVYFGEDSYEMAKNQFEEKGGVFPRLYFQKVNSLFKGKTFDESQEIEDSQREAKKIDVDIDEIKKEMSESSKKNKEDVIQMLGYDPFTNVANVDDREFLYDRLVGFLDESTLQDGFKLPTVIEIVRGFRQIDKINDAIDDIIHEKEDIFGKVGGLKSFLDSKKALSQSLLSLAKDNGISVNHNNDKSKGAGTLSGIIKELREKGFEQAEVNMYDIETSEGILQVANLSNESLTKQLLLDENDYTAMIIEQKELIHELDSKLTTSEEELRKLKIELMKYRE